MHKAHLYLAFPNPKVTANIRNCFFFIIPDIRDDTNVLAQSLTEKYMVGADMTNFTSMTPGLTDVSKLLYIDRLSKLFKHRCVLPFDFFLVRCWACCSLNQLATKLFASILCTMRAHIGTLLITKGETACISIFSLLILPITHLFLTVRLVIVNVKTCFLSDYQHIFKTR